VYDELYFWYCQWRSAQGSFSMDTLRRYPAANVIIDQACSWLSELQQKHFFLWIHLMDPHHPYYPPQEALSALGASHITTRRARLLNSLWNRSDIGQRRLQRYRTEILSLYDAGVYWVDQQISRMVHVMQQSRRWDETVFVVTADHGEEFLEHGNRYHSPINLPEQLIRVPLLVRAPELSGTQISQPFSLIHLAPTLLEAVGATISESFQGGSHWQQILTGNLPSETAITECIEGCNNPFRIDDRLHPRLMAIQRNEYKLVIHFSDKTDYFYDLKNDPEECSPLPTGVQTKERVRLLQIARGHLQKSKRDRNADLALRARAREIRQSLGAKSEAVSASATSH
jgi:arylsulfatase A-like enzyme